MNFFDADFAAVTAFTADVIHLCPDFLEWEQGAGVCSKGFIHEILNTKCARFDMPTAIARRTRCSMFFGASLKSSQS